MLTPHAGELARLLDRDSAWVDAHRLEAARACAERYGAVVLLKGAGTIVQAPTASPVVCDTGPPSLATAGTGDVLTGVVAAFLAKGLDPVTAAAAAATAHGLAAAVAPHQAGLVASDVIAELPAGSRPEQRWPPRAASDRMRVEILGSGGAATIPRPGCHCRVCVEAREKGGRYARTGPSTFVHGPNILFDTPEESKFQLERARIGEIAACFYSHWHPDHTMGRRVWETRNGDFRTWPREAKRPLVTDIYLPRAGRRRTSASGSAAWRTSSSCATAAGSGSTSCATARPSRSAASPCARSGSREDYVYAFELTDGERRLLVAMDELNGWSPPAEVKGCDLAVLPMGICEFDLFTGERLIHEEHPVLAFEATFEETLGIVAELDAARVVLSHVEEMDCISYADLLRVEQRLQAEGRNVSFAWDGLTIDV